MGEEFPDRGAQNRGLLGKACRPIEVHEQRKLRVTGHVASPVDDELLGVGIQVLFAKWGWIDRVEELFQLRHMDLDHLAIRGDWIAGRALYRVLKI